MFDEIEATTVWLGVRLTKPETWDEMRDVVQRDINEVAPRRQALHARLRRKPERTQRASAKLRRQLAKERQERERHGGPEWSELVAFANGEGDVPCPCGSGTAASRCLTEHRGRRADAEACAAKARYGPNGVLIQQLMEQAWAMTPDQGLRLLRERDKWLDDIALYWELYSGPVTDAAARTGRGDVWNAACDDAKAAALPHFVRSAPNKPLPGDVAAIAATALVVRDIIPEEDFRTLYAPWAAVFGWPAA
jgi:hypothetical protein